MLNNEQIDLDDPNIVLSPLADPVFGAIYANAEVAGLAMESLIRATLETDAESLIGKVKTVTPQQIHTSTRGRGCRVDIESDTDANERVITEVQINPDKRIMIRNLFASSHIFYGASDKGDTVAQMSGKLPRVIHINILGYNIRNNNAELVQPFKIMYTKKPKEVAIPSFSGYNIQLPRILAMEPDFTNSLYCWCYTLYTAHVEGKTVKEVVSMSTALQDYAKQDAGFQQFCERYNFVSADPKTRKEYVLWANDRMREAGEREWAYDEGFDKGTNKGIETVAINMLKRNKPLTEIVEDTGLSLEKVLTLQKNLSQSPS